MFNVPGDTQMAKISPTRQIAQLTAQVADLTAKLKSAENSRDYHATRATTAEGEIAQVHMLLDATPTPPPRKSSENDYQTFNAMTRLAAWLAHRP
jgi:outer membrane murein-binding lipoprotein Lpp